jgi:hypothetical protein
MQGYDEEGQKQDRIEEEDPSWLFVCLNLI